MNTQKLPRSSVFSVVRLLLAAFLFLGLLQQQVSATSYSWINAKITTWSDTTGWSGGVAPVSDLDNVLTFSTTLNTTATNNLGTINLNRLNAANVGSSKNLTIAGSSVNNLNFVKDSLDVLPTFTIANNSATGSLNVTIPFTVTDALTITNSGSRGSTVSGAITNTGGMTFDGTGAGSITLGTGIISGAGGITYSGSYTVVASGGSTYTGVTTLSNGTVSVSSINNGGAAGNLGRATADSSNLIFNGGTLRYSGATNSSDRAFTINADKTATIDISTAASNLTLSAGATGAATNGALTKTGAGTLTLSGVNTYTGATTVSAGTLILAGSGSINSSAVTVNGGAFRNNSSTAYSGTLTFTSGSIGGTNMSGSLGGLTIGAGQTISPGNSPGTAATTDQTWAGGGSYLFEVNNATGTAGSDPGWDLLTGTGTLSLTATSGSKFNIVLTSLTLSNVGGDAANFDGLLSYNWKLADFVNPVAGFDSAAFNVDRSAFSNAATGTFAVVLGDTVSGGNSGQLYLAYTAVPEPATWALLAFSLTAMVVLRRRRD